VILKGRGRVIKEEDKKRRTFEIRKEEKKRKRT
jgi:hypothetical protein